MLPSGEAQSNVANSQRGAMSAVCPMKSDVVVWAENVNAEGVLDRRRRDLPTR